MKLLHALFLLAFIPALAQTITYKIPDASPTAMVAATVASQEQSLTPQAVDAYVRSRAPLYGVNPAYASCVVSHESQDTDRDGDDGNSRGYWQISSIWHPEVSDATAHTLTSSTDWSLTQIAKGDYKQWSTYWLFCSSTPVLF